MAQKGHPSGEAAPELAGGRREDEDEDGVGEDHIEVALAFVKARAGFRKKCFWLVASNRLLGVQRGAHQKRG